MNEGKPKLLERLAGVAVYLGLAPVIHWCFKCSNPYRQRHVAQAMAGFFLLILWGVVSAAFNAAATFILIYFPGLDRRADSFELYFCYFLFGTLFLLCLLWVVFMGMALAGSSRRLPGLGKLAEKRWIVRNSLFVNAAALGVFLLGMAAAWRANSMTCRNREQAAVYFLYDEGAGVPRCLFALGLYRVMVEAEGKWGKGCTVLDSLNEKTLITALANGKVLILATHGEKGCAFTYYSPVCLCIGAADKGVKDKTYGSRFLSMGAVGPDNRFTKSENLPVNNDLRLAYIFACNAGNRAAEWTEHLAPAQVVTYNRVSTLLDHASWFAFTGPQMIDGLK